jgi:ribosomal protein S14
MKGNRQQEWIRLDKFRRHFFVKYEIKKMIQKSIIRNRTLPMSYRFFLKFRMASVITSSSLTKHRNRCVVSGRSYNVLQKTQYSRFVFRDRANFGYLPGVSRLSR